MSNMPKLSTRAQKALDILADGGRFVNRNDIPASSHQFGIIRTDRALSADEIATYELERR